jgi:hypothetical protein
VTTNAVKKKEVKDKKNISAVEDGGFAGDDLAMVVVG